MTIIKCNMCGGALEINNNATALWFVCANNPGESNAVAVRKIAKLLLDNGAELDATNTGGIDLYNKETDYEIEPMIKDKFPTQKKE